VTFFNIRRCECVDSGVLISLGSVSAVEIEEKRG